MVTTLPPFLSSLEAVGDTQSSPITVTCIDDYPAYSAMLESRLSRNDRFEVRTETDPTAVLGSLEHTDCVVSDDKMTVMDGDELLTEIRTRDGTLPYVLLTHSRDNRIGTAVRAADCTAVLKKRTVASATGYLADRIDALVERRRAAEFARGGLAAAESMSAGVALTGSDGRFIYVDQSFATLLGYDTETLVGRSWRTVFTDDEVQRIDESWLTAVQEGWHWSGTCTAERATGETVSVGTTVAGFTDGCLVFLFESD